MTAERVDRRLAAVLAADVSGYSRLMGADEVGTLTALKSIRREIVDPAIAVHKGRIVKTTGDGMLVEFASAVDAVTCAMAMQDKMARRNGDTAPRIDFRIGINVGDIIIDGDDIFGDGVNVAARVESECEPGGVCLSGSAVDQVRGKTGFAFDDLGERPLKNIDRPVRLYAVRTAAPASGKAVAERSKPLALPDKPSIAVLPFQNMSGNPEQEYFADGVVEDIITALSRFKSLFVIARNSSFTYKGKSVDIKQVGRELGVRYVLEGSVRTAGGRIRLTGQLIEAATGSHLWADRFDGAADDIFDLQDRITASVVGLIAPTVERAEIERAKRKPTEQLDSYDLYLRGMAILRGQRTSSQARALFLKAIEKDAEYGAAHSMVAWTLLMEQSISGARLSEENRTEAIRRARLAASLAPGDSFSLARAGHVLTYLGREYDLGSSLVTEAVALNPNLSTAWYSKGWIDLMRGEAKDAIDSFDKALRFSPLDTLRGSCLNGRAFSFFLLERYPEGCESAERALQVYTDVHTLCALIINRLRAGLEAEASDAVRRLLRLQPDFRASHSIDAFPVRTAESRQRMLAALTDAGVPL